MVNEKIEDLKFYENSYLETVREMEKIAGGDAQSSKPEPNEDEITLPEWVGNPDESVNLDSGLKEVIGSHGHREMDTEPIGPDLEDPKTIGNRFEGLDTDALPTKTLGEETVNRFKEYLDFNVFKPVNEAIDTDYWNPTIINKFNEDLTWNKDSNKYGKLIAPVGDDELPTRLNSYKGEAGKLSVEKFGKYFTRTDTQYNPTEDAQPVSEMAHGAIMHAAGVLMKYGAEAEGDGIRAEDLDSGDAEEVVQAYTVLDSLLQSETWDQRTFAEQLQESVDWYGTSKEYDLDGKLLD